MVRKDNSYCLQVRNISGNEELLTLYEHLDFWWGPCLILHTGLKLPFVLHLLVGTSCKKNASLTVHKDTNEQHNVRSSCWGSGAKQQPRPYPSSPPFLWQLKHLFVTQINYTYIQSWLIVFKLALVLSIADI
jgi:hypothetical protein